MKRFAVLLCSILVFGFVGQALAGYQISYMWVQHRVLEDGRDFNRLGFEIVDDTGAPVRENLITSIRLLKGTNELPLIQGGFGPHDLALWGGYDAGTGQWYYDEQVRDNSYYYYTIDTAKLRKGVYKLVVKYNGERLVKTYTFNGLVDLPIVQGKRIKASMDGRGNLYCSWVVPTKLYYLTDVATPPAISARAQIEIYQNNQYVGYVDIRIPAHLNKVFIPTRVIDQLKTIPGATYRFKVQLRSNDNGNRTFSDYIDLEL